MESKGLITNMALRVALCLLLSLPVSMGVATDTGSAGTARAAKMTFTPKGMIDQTEVNNFKDYMKTGVNWPTTPLYRNHYMYGTEGKNIDACIQMFELTGDVEFLDFVLTKLDFEFYTRNDQPGGEHLVIDDPFGEVADVWPYKQEKTDADGNVTGYYYSALVEQGEALESFAYAARLIIDNPVLWNEKITTGDKYGYGATYLERALFYLDMCDKTYDVWLSRFVNSKDKVFYRHNGTTLYEPIAFNQAFMACNGLDMMAQCHARLGNVERAATYDAIVLANLKFFVSKMWMDSTLEEGKTYIQWRYNAPSKGSSPVEDIGHGSFDAYILYNIYVGGRHNYEDIGMNKLTGTTEKGMRPLLEEMGKTVYGLIYGKGMDSEGKFPGRMNGTYEDKYRDNYVRDYFFGMLDMVPEWYDKAHEINKNRYAGSMPTVSRMLWAKSRRVSAPLNDEAGYSEIVMVATADNIGEMKALTKMPSKTIANIVLNVKDAWVAYRSAKDCYLEDASGAVVLSDCANYCLPVKDLKTGDRLTSGKLLVSYYLNGDEIGSKDNKTSVPMPIVSDAVALEPVTAVSGEQVVWPFPFDNIKELPAGDAWLIGSEVHRGKFKCSLRYIQHSEDRR